VLNHPGLCAACVCLRQQQSRVHTIETGTLLEKVQAYSDMAADYLRDHPMIIVNAVIALIAGMVYMLIFGPWGSAPRKSDKQDDKKTDKEGEEVTTGSKVQKISESKGELTAEGVEVAEREDKED
jgi:hypothetical protein